MNTEAVHGSRLVAGTVLRARGGEYLVDAEDGETRTASLRGRLRLEQRTGDRVVAGDRVRILLHNDGSCTIEHVEDRRSQLARRAPGRGHPRARVMIANVDQVVIVVAAARPEPRLRMIDRFLVLAETNGLPAFIVVNKADLPEADTIAARFQPYDLAGYPVVATSVIDGHGLEEFRERLCGRESVLTGPSGVGKSSLLNAIQPGLGLRIGAIGEAAGKGRHTTVTAELIPLSCSGYVGDTPGLREVGLWAVDPDSLDTAFPEFRPLLGTCRFGNSCTHVHEPDCAVRDAVAEGRIDSGRFQSYLAMREDE
jgi:ribosome biogenesis GTPase / thiamine phosphate phosphatase